MKNTFFIVIFLLFSKLLPAQSLSPHLLDSILSWYFDRYNKADTLLYVQTYFCHTRQVPPCLCFDTIARPATIKGKKLIYLDWINNKKPKISPPEKEFKVLDFCFRKAKTKQDTLIVPLHLCDARIRKEDGAYLLNSPETNTKIDIYLKFNNELREYEIINFIESP